MKLHYIGIDPGKSGGVAIIGQSGSLIASAPAASAQEVWDFIAENSATLCCTIALEDAPTHCPSAKALRSLALSVGEIKGYLSARMPEAVILMPSAAAWQRKVLGSVPKGQSKEFALAKARQLWPDETWIMPRGRVPHDGRIDSALLAYYAFSK